MRLQNTAELGRLNGYIQAMSCCLNGCNYVIWVSARGVKLEDGDLEPQTLDKLAISETLQEPTPDLELQKLIQLAYPEAKPNLATVFECHHGPTLLINRINSLIARINPSDGFKNVEKSKKHDLIRCFWRNVSECIDYQNVRVFQYNPAFNVDDELWDFVIWVFTFLVVNEEQRRCLLIHGAVSN